MPTKAERIAALQQASNHDLAEALNDPNRSEDYYYIREEIDRRNKAKADERKAEEDVRPFNPRVDISADVRWLWRKIVIWFMIVPAIVGLALWILSSAAR